MTFTSSTTEPAPVLNRPFTFSYSRLKNYESCPRRHLEIDLLKNFQEEKSEALLWGDEVHKAAAERLRNNTPLPPSMSALEKWCQDILTGEGKILVEQKLAITRDFAPCGGFFDKNVWFRSVADVIKIVGPVALTCDWKTGKVADEPMQLALCSACIFAHHPQVQKIRTEFVWLKEGYGVSTRNDFSRSEIVNIWRNVWPRIEQLEHAYNTNNYPPKPGGLCRKWCVVKSCEFNGGN